MPLTGIYAPSAVTSARQQAEVYEATDGREENTLEGRPIVVMTSLGAKSGYLRKTPLMRIEHEGSYAVIASNGGQATHPVWYYNLKKTPLVELQDGAVKRDYDVREVDGTEREEWWKRAVATWPDFDRYIIGLERTIPLFVLTPTDA
ncbi:nitroreductase family deazaflavin-dependent oxidoreductase [Herbiconiux sp. P17]|uniref:nitroreductase family deazaflavin-dependent oxidoreductase n=1 Tax=Herbiconiux wuyangfengii TaxID=3342794 RepID=UPI0035BA4B62